MFEAMKLDPFYSYIVDELERTMARTYHSSGDDSWDVTFSS